MSFSVYPNSSCDTCSTKGITAYGLGSSPGREDQGDVMAFCEKCLVGSKHAYQRHVKMGNIDNKIVSDYVNAKHAYKLWMKKEQKLDENAIAKMQVKE